MSLTSALIDKLKSGSVVITTDYRLGEGFLLLNSMEGENPGLTRHPKTETQETLSTRHPKPWRPPRRDRKPWKLQTLGTLNLNAMAGDNRSLTRPLVNPPNLNESRCDGHGFML